MRIVVVGYDKMFSNLVLGSLDAGHKIVGVLRHERVSISPLFLFFKDLLFPSKDYSFIRSLGLHEINVRSVNSREFCNQILRLSPDVILVGSWSEKFKKNVIELPKLGTINCHPSLLPAYRGPNPYMRVIMNGEEESGITLHLMDENLDTGPILLQKRIAIKQGFDGDTGESLKNKCCSLARVAIAELLTRMNNEMVIPINQKDTGASYYPQISEKDILIDFEKKSSDINALVRALTPWQPAYIPHKRVFIQVGKVEFFENNTKYKLGMYKAGMVIKRNFRSIWVLTGDNRIAKLSKLKLFCKIGKIFTPLYLKLFVKIGDFCK